MIDEELVDQVERIFAVVIARARSDHAFARQLAAAVTDGQLKKSAERKRSPQPTAPEINIQPITSNESADQARALLRQHARSDLYEYVRANKISPTGTSKFNKQQLIEHIVRTLRNSEARRRLDY